MDETERLEVTFRRTLKKDKEKNEFAQVSGIEVHFRRWAETDLRFQGLSNIAVSPFSRSGSDLLVTMTFDFKAGKRPVIKAYPPWRVGEIVRPIDLSKWLT